MYFLVNLRISRQIDTKVVVRPLHIIILYLLHLSVIPSS